MHLLRTLFSNNPCKWQLDWPPNTTSCWYITIWFRNLKFHNKSINTYGWAVMTRLVHIAVNHAFLRRYLRWCIPWYDLVWFEIPRHIIYIYIMDPTIIRESKHLRLFGWWINKTLAPRLSRPREVGLELMVTWDRQRAGKHYKHDGREVKHGFLWFMVCGLCPRPIDATLTMISLQHVWFMHATPHKISHRKS